MIWTRIIVGKLIGHFPVPQGVKLTSATESEPEEVPLSL